jgi:microcystin degradation protein MlrC
MSIQRFFFSKLVTETNTFSNIPTTLASFELAAGEAVFEDPVLARLRSELAAEEIELVAGLSAYAEPGAPVQAQCYVTLRERLLSELKRSLPVDAVVLHLHGAMVSQQCDDCEGDVLTRIRELVGPRVPVGAVLDPHAHLTPAMVVHSDILAFMKEYPHTDWEERKDAVIRVLRGILAGNIIPVPAVVDCRMQGFFPTQTQPMRGFVEGLRALEGQRAVLDISFVHGFPFGDTEHTGSKVLVYANGDAREAARIAEDLRTRLWSMRREAMLSLSTLEAALSAMGSSRERPLVVADFADNPGGGAPSDNVSMLRAMVERGLGKVVIGLICDPQAVRTCHEVGIGGRIDLRIGGKTGRASGLPIDLEVEVLELASDAYMESGEDRYPLGDTAWIRHAGIDIVLSSRRMQLLDPSGLTHLGIDPLKYSTIVVKSSNHFAAGFAQIAGEMMHVSAAGALHTNLINIPYRKLKSRWYPKDPNPFGTP